MRAYNETVIIEPLYDADSVWGIVLPDVAKNTESCHGYVVAAGRKSGFNYPNLVFFRHYKGKIIEKVWIEEREYLVLDRKHIVAKVAEDGSLQPNEEVVLIRPDFGSRYESRSPSGLILLDPQIFGGHIAKPIWQGTVIATGKRTRELLLDDRVVIPTDKGTEIVWRESNLYLIEEADILARIEQ